MAEKGGEVIALVYVVMATISLQLHNIFQKYTIDTQQPSHHIVCI